MWFLRILSFFPSITFSLLNAEIFPWAFLAAGYYVMRTLMASRIPFPINLYKNVGPLMVLFIISIYCASFYVSFKGDLKPDILRSFGAYLNPLVIFLFLLECPEKEISYFKKLINVLFFVLILLGFSQALGVVNFLDPVFKFLIPRGNATLTGGAGGRGIRLLSSEPARAAYELFFIYIAWVYLREQSVIKQLFLDIFMFLFFILMIRSAMGMVLFAVYIVLKYRLKLFLALLPALIIGLPFIIGILENASSRSMKVLYNIMMSSNLEEVCRYLLSASGDRIVSILSSYKYAFTHPFGGGVGLWAHSSLDALNSVNIHASMIGYFANKGNGGYFSVRPTSYMANIALDLGIIGVLFVLYMLRPVLALLKNYRHPIFPVTICFLFGIMMSGAAGNPVPWIAMALVYRKFISMESFYFQNQQRLEEQFYEKSNYEEI
jgi:hypothetical protein